MSYGPEEGNDHTCIDCGAKWWDSDGGCSCTKCRHCGKVGDEDFASDGYCADCKDAEIELLNEVLKQAENTSEARRCANMVLCDELDAMHDRIRVLEFQSAELRAQK